MTIIDFFFFFSCGVASISGWKASVLAQSNGHRRGRFCIIVAFVRAGRLSMKCCCRYLQVYKRKITLHAYLMFVIAIVSK